MQPAPERRAIFVREDMAEMSIGGQIVMATANLGAHASRIRQELDVESLYFHCQRAMEELKTSEVSAATTPDERTLIKMAKFRASRGLQLATAALAFLKAYDEANKEEMP